MDLSWHRVYAICARYVELVQGDEDLAAMYNVAIDETSSGCTRNYLKLVADMPRARAAVENMRRIEQKDNWAAKGMGWSVLKDCNNWVPIGVRLH